MPNLPSFEMALTLTETATQLFAGVDIFGFCRCFYCGGLCDEKTPAAKHVKSSFTSRDTVAGGDWVCDGCIAAMNESTSIELPDGTVREKQKVRCYSWVISSGRKTAATKSHREWLMRQCLSPPDPPFVICISDSGQKHLLYRAVVCHSREMVIVTLESERIIYLPCELSDRLILCKKIAAAVGKPALSEPLSVRQQMTAVDYHQSDCPLREWNRIRETPLARLASWFTPPMKECQIEYTKHSATQRA